MLFAQYDNWEICGILIMGTSSQCPHYIATDFYIYQGMQLSALSDGRMFIRHEKEYLFITDIQVEINQGMGTLLMEELFKYAKMSNVGMVVGNLERRDLEDHGERLIHFYHKFGFVITDLEHGRKHIELIL